MGGIRAWFAVMVVMILVVLVVVRVDMLVMSLCFWVFDNIYFVEDDFDGCL